MKIAVGLSGGVDSSVAALLLKRAGHEVVGVTMKLWKEGRYKGGGFDACFGPGELDDIAEAEKLAAKLGIAYHVFDCADRYEAEVIRYFREEREAGRTPNPCVVCNRLMKFGLLPEMAREALDFDRFATGHYARIVPAASGTSPRHDLLRAVHTQKDQSYFLWRLTEAQRAMAMFPLGELTKTEVRALAREASLAMAEKADSQDFYSGDVNELLSLAPREGNIVDTSGKVRAKHQGHWHFTVGQRKGLGFAAGEPMYVVDVNACRNEVVVGSRAEAVVHDFSIDLNSVNFVSMEPTDRPVVGRVKVRSAQEPVGPVVYENGAFHSDAGIFGVAPGQSAVLYALESEELLLGAVIGGRGTVAGERSS